MISIGVLINIVKSNHLRTHAGLSMPMISTEGTRVKNRTEPFYDLKTIPECKWLSME
jgi:hypothetical protein